MPPVATVPGPLAVDMPRPGSVEHALRRSAERFGLVVSAEPSAMVMIRADGKIEMVNAQAKRVFGYPREQVALGAVQSREWRMSGGAAARGFPDKPARGALTVSGISIVRRHVGIIRKILLTTGPWRCVAEAAMLIYRLMSPERSAARIRSFFFTTSAPVRTLR